jgi:Domain of unknown function (DUF4386)
MDPPPRPRVTNACRNFITSAGSSTGVLSGAFLEVIVALAGIGTAVALFPVLKRQNEGMALGFAAVRTLEAAMIFTGVLSLLTLVHQSHSGRVSPLVAR